MKLATGLQIEEAQSILSGYLKGVYYRYDSKPVAEDNALLRADVLVSRSLVSRISDDQVDSILCLSEQCTSALRAIPCGVDLIDVPPDDPIPGAEAISRLVTLLCGLRGVKLAKATKILHRKRPSLIPVLDSVIETHYWPKFVPSVKGRSWGDYALALHKAFHRDMHSVADELRTLRQFTLTRGTPLSHCRILDALIWAVCTGNASYYRRRA